MLYTAFRYYLLNFKDSMSFEDFCENFGLDRFFSDIDTYIKNGNKMKLKDYRLILNNEYGFK